MTEIVRTVRLYGPLGAKFGRVHRLSVRSAREAAIALSNLLPGFRKEMVESAENGVRYACFLGKVNLSEDQLDLGAGRQDIRIAPVMQGAKKGGLFTVVLGVALIAGAMFLSAGTFVGPLAAGQSLFSAEMGMAAFGTSFTYGNIAMMGAALALSGVSQMLTKTPTGLRSDSVDNGKSYGFGGAENRTQQGLPVPLIYGRAIYAPPAISAATYAEDQQ